MNVCCTQRVCCRWRWRSLRLVAFYQQASPTMVLNLTWAATRKQVQLMEWKIIVRFTRFTECYDSHRIAFTITVHKWWVHCRLLSHLLSSCWVIAKFHYTGPTRPDRTRPDKVRARCQRQAKTHYTDPTGPARTFLRPGSSRNSVKSVRVSDKVCAGPVRVVT